MSDLFFYGTLQYVPLLERVLNREPGDLQTEAAVLSDHAVFAVKDQPFPMIMAKPGGAAQGLLVRGLSQEDRDRLDFYEGGFDYALDTRTIALADGETAQALVFFPAPGLWTPDKPWSLQIWADEWGALTVLAAEDVMAQYGILSPAEIAKAFPAARMRAWAKLEARKRLTDDPRSVAKDVIVHSHKRAYLGYFGMEEIEFQHRQHDGTMGPVLHRSALMQGSAVVLLPYDPVRDLVLLVEQFRTPAFLIDDPEPWLWEPVAGMIDPGETPEQAVHRESMEEAQTELTSLHYVGGAYSSTGSSTEFAHLYVGLGDLTETTESGGLQSEGEDIRSKILPYEEFMQMVDTHVFKDMPLLTLAHWLARHRDQLRQP
ncbi:MULTISPECIES: NUDIX domain-containing protein [unclassified Ruegeria]|uniref:NUDIX domain-containing protein n=1 Tax=unclassified Ruegeria TaxID=2625375 RepID=UPI001488FB8D|nr:MULTISPECIES: NUDIX domain-containing protein [unclassified Ruegeria]